MEIEERIAEKEGRLEELKAQIDDTKSNIHSLNEQLASLKSSITSFENANKMFRHMTPVTIPEQDVDEDEEYEINEEHLTILKEKRNLIPPLLAKITEINHEKTQAEEQLEKLREDCVDFSKEILDLNEEIRSANSEISRIQNECFYVQEQVSERNTEIKSMETLKRDAESAYSELLERARNFETADGGKLDTEKQIISFQEQLRQIESEIAEIEYRMMEADAQDQKDVNDAKQQQQVLEKAVDWQAERNDLQNELKKLREGIASRKSTLTTNENHITQKQESLAKYGPLVKKWRGKLTDADLSEAEIQDKTIQQLWNEMESSRVESEESQKNAERELSELVLQNAKLEEEVNRKRMMLERAITQAHSDQFQLRKRINDKRSAAMIEEQKLLQHIQKTKLKIAANNMRKQ